MHQDSPLVWIPTNGDTPVPDARGFFDRPLVQPADWGWDAALQLSDEVVDGSVLAELGRQSAGLNRLELGGGLRALAIALHDREVLVVDLAAGPEAARPKEVHGHGAARAEAHPRAMGRGAVVLAAVGHRQDRRSQAFCVSDLGRSALDQAWQGMNPAGQFLADHPRCGLPSEQPPAQRRSPQGPRTDVEAEAQ